MLPADASSSVARGAGHVAFSRPFRYAKSMKRAEGMMRTKISGHDSVVRHPEFAQRFAQCLDTNQNVPSHRRGRYTWIVEQLADRYEIDVTLETVRKWFEGMTKPRPEKMKALANLLDVREGWLSVGGDEETASKREVREQFREQDGAVLAVAAQVQLAGNHIAFPEKGDRRAERDKIDFYSFIRGVQYAFHVSRSVKADSGYRFDVPSNYDTAFQVGVIQSDTDMSLRFVEIPHDLVALGRARGSHIEVELNSAEISANEIKTFRERL